MLIPLSSSKPKINNGDRRVNPSWGSSHTIPKLMKKQIRHDFIYLQVLLENLHNTLSSGGLHALNDQHSNRTIAKYKQAKVSA